MKELGSNNIRLIFYLRWIAILGQIIAIYFTHYIIKIELPIKEMSCLVFGLTIFNFFTYARIKEKHVSDKEIFIQLLFDILILAGLLYFSGGGANPFISLFLLQIVIASIILNKYYTWTLVFITICCYLTLTFWYIEIPHFHHYHIGDFFNMHLHGMFIAFILSSVIIAHFVVRMSNNLQQAREQQNAEEHIIKIGMLAAGAAHELSTPLSTIAIITREVIKDAAKTKKHIPDILDNLKMMEKQVEKCKLVISDVLTASGKTRGENAKTIHLKKYFTDISNSWTKLNSHNIKYMHSGANPKIITDIVLTQAITNFLDNSKEANAKNIELNTICKNNFLEIIIQDDGKGFKAKGSIGKPYSSTKKKEGGGLGIFLSQSVIKRLRGNIDFIDRKKGAIVKIIIPLDSIIYE